MATVSRRLGHIYINHADQGCLIALSGWETIAPGEIGSIFFRLVLERLVQ